MAQWNSCGRWPSVSLTRIRSWQVVELSKTAGGTTAFRALPIFFRDVCTNNSTRNQETLAAPPKYMYIYIHVYIHIFIYTYLYVKISHPSFLLHKFPWPWHPLLPGTMQALMMAELMEEPNVEPLSNVLEVPKNEFSTVNGAKRLQGYPCVERCMFILVIRC